jgi:hypothetical protein
MASTPTRTAAARRLRSKTALAAVTVAPTRQVSGPADPDDVLTIASEAARRLRVSNDGAAAPDDTATLASLRRTLSANRAVTATLARRSKPTPR